jgi:hypothetical protein
VLKALSLPDSVAPVVPFRLSAPLLSGEVM